MGKRKNNRPTKAMVTEVATLDFSPVVDKLDRIERLLMLLVAKFGAGSPEIGAALAVTGASVRQRFPFRKVTTARMELASKE